MRRRVPLSTYRLQLGPDLDFAEAARHVDVIADLGVTHLYLSPIMTAAPGSTHGYDVADPQRVADALGGESGLRALADAAHARDLGLVVDVVPNHMAADVANPHWRELLASGRRGPAGNVFDVDWRPAMPELTDTVVLPVLGDRYGEVLRAGELSLVSEGDGVAVAYYDARFPVSSSSTEAVQRAGGVQTFSGRPGDLRSWSRLHAVLEAQAYRLVHWRAGDAIGNYRRFFTIAGLAAVRVEVPEVFDLVHDAILSLVDEGVVDGLRIDHPDGLRDPTRYFERLAERSGGAWTVAEKITHPGESLPPWPVAGTTGYEATNEIMAVLAVDPAAAETLTRLDADLGARLDYDEQARRGVVEMLRSGLATDVDRLARLLWTACARDPVSRDVGLRACQAAVEALVAGIDVYRPYVDPETGEATQRDRDVVGRARAAAEGSAPAWLLDHAAAIVLGDVEAGAAGDELLARYPQVTSAAIAKGTEDTAFYRYRRLLAVNEVGGDPGTLGMGVGAFHERNRERSERHPEAMLTTATHDTKRGEDTRLRMAALSEMAGEWAAACRSWLPGVPDALDGQVATLVWQTMVGIWPLTGRPDQAWRDRLVAYLVKAEREAAERTLWTDPDERVETALGSYIDALLADERVREELAALADRAAEIAMVTGLAQTLLRATMPGVPDTYQGMERWDDHLVDPDNRRPVDWEDRRTLLAGLADADPSSLWSARRDGRVKAHVLATALRLRRDRPATFGAGGAYRALEVTGTSAEHVIAFARGEGAEAAVVVVPRLPGSLVARGSVLTDAWGDTAVVLPEATTWHARLVGGEGAAEGPTPVSRLLVHLPVALLVAGPDQRA